MTFSVVMTLVTSFVRGMINGLFVAGILALLLVVFVRGNVFLLVSGLLVLLLCVLAYTAWTMLSAFRLEFGATSGTILGVERLMASETAPLDGEARTNADRA
ncbi:hypothetical protein ACFY9N_05740 [Microbacterium sp. NPDC008134]|uniref:hypothetical protein n=1 Tax=Microbacterium sp. NPDC008134 TaxID=3364183 RepID=UPI0036E4CC18